MKTKGQIGCVVITKLISNLCFHYIESEIQNLKPQAIFCGCLAQFVSDLVGNLKTGFLATRLINILPDLKHIRGIFDDNQGRILHFLNCHKSGTISPPKNCPRYVFFLFLSLSHLCDTTDTSLWGIR